MSVKLFRAFGRTDAYSSKHFSHFIFDHYNNHYSEYASKLYEFFLPTAYRKMSETWVFSLTSE